MLVLWICLYAVILELLGGNLSFRRNAKALLMCLADIPLFHSFNCLSNHLCQPQKLMTIINSGDHYLNRNQAKYFEKTLGGPYFCIFCISKFQ